MYIIGKRGVILCKKHKNKKKKKLIKKFWIDQEKFKNNKKIFLVIFIF